MDRRELLLVGIAASFARSADAQTFTIEAVWVNALRLHFESQYDTVQAIRSAQRLLIAAGYSGDLPDGIWGPQTQAAFMNVAQTILAIGTQTDPRRVEPRVVAEETIGWLTALVRSYTLNTDVPD